MSKFAFFGLIWVSAIFAVFCETPSSVKVNETKDVCDVCECKGDSIDCSGRGLYDSLSDFRWPNKTLKEVNFRRNKIERIKQFPNVTINRLILAENKVKKIDHAAFKYVKDLRHLDLGTNLLDPEHLLPDIFEGMVIPNEYEPLLHLNYLSLENNLLHTVNRDLCEHLQHVAILKLGRNPLDEFPQALAYALAQISSLKELDLSFTNMASIGTTRLHTLRDLKKLNLTGNRFTSLPDVLEDIHSLETLIFNGNPVSELSSTNGFPSMKHLKELQMSNMPELKNIGSGAFSNLTELEVLQIENCTKLLTIHEEAFISGDKTLPPLKRLRLAGNSLQYLPFDLLATGWDRLDELDLRGNNWSCDCSNQPLIGAILPRVYQRLNNTDYDKLLCSAPDEHFGKTLKSLENRNLRCLDYYGSHPEQDAIVFVGIFLGLILAVPIVLSFFVLWTRGYFFFGRQGPASFSRAYYKRAPFTRSTDDC